MTERGVDGSLKLADKYDVVVWSEYSWLIVHGNEFPGSVMGRELHDGAMS